MTRLLRACGAHRGVANSSSLACPAPSFDWPCQLQGIIWGVRDSCRGLRPFSCSGLLLCQYLLQ